MYRFYRKVGQMRSRYLTGQGCWGLKRGSSGRRRVTCARDRRDFDSRVCRHTRVPRHMTLTHACTTSHGADTHTSVSRRVLLTCARWKGQWEQGEEAQGGEPEREMSDRERLQGHYVVTCSFAAHVTIT
eukprot:1415575-Rhodomonas_salina.1